MWHLIIFIVLIAGAIAFYHLWGATQATVFLITGLVIEGAAYWWMSRAEKAE